MVPVQQQVTHNPLLLLVASTVTPKFNLLAAYDCTHNYIFSTSDLGHVTRVMVTAKQLVPDNIFQFNYLFNLIALFAIYYPLHQKNHHK